MTLPLRGGETYRVRIRAEDDVVQLPLAPSSTGESVSVGPFTDVKGTLSHGRIGFAGSDRETIRANGPTVWPTFNNTRP